LIPVSIGSQPACDLVINLAVAVITFWGPRLTYQPKYITG